MSFPWKTSRLNCSARIVNRFGFNPSSLPSGRFGCLSPRPPGGKYSKRATAESSTRYVPESIGYTGASTAHRLEVFAPRPRREIGPLLFSCAEQALDFAKYQKHIHWFLKNAVGNSHHFFDVRGLDTGKDDRRGPEA